MKKVFLGLSAVALLAFTACEKKEAVEVKDAEEVAVGSETTANLAVDTEVSNVNWRGYKIYEGETEEQGHHGTIKLQSGVIGIEDGQLVSGEFVIDATSLESMDLNEFPEDKAKLDGHLRSADFLDVEKYPTATFKITDVNKIEGDYNTEISGNLKLREDEKNITFKANTAVEGETFTMDSEEFTINRQDFGIDFNGPGAVIKDNVTLSVNIKANQGTAEVVDVEATEEAAAAE